MGNFLATFILGFTALTVVTFIGSVCVFLVACLILLLTGSGIPWYGAIGLIAAFVFASYAIGRWLNDHY